MRIKNLKKKTHLSSATRTKTSPNLKLLFKKNFGRNGKCDRNRIKKGLKKKIKREKNETEKRSKYKREIKVQKKKGYKKSKKILEKVIEALKKAI